MSKWRRVHVAAAALILGVPASALALSATGHPTVIHLGGHARHVHYGRELTLSGVASGAQTGEPVQLEFARAGTSSWQTVASTRVASGGAFRLKAALPHTGLVRVGTTPSATSAQASSAGPAQPRGGSDPSSSAPERITVAAEFRLRPRTRDALGGQPIHVHGRLLPGAAGRRVALQGLDAGRWRTLAASRTASGGGFDLRYAPGGTGEQRLRVKFSGDRLNTRTTAPAGRVTGFRQTVASWYDDGGSTACGFHAQYGVASPSLPCGTSVTFLYGGRKVTATVDDRGPFVGGRDWDLNQNTASALGMGGVDTVWSSR